MVNPLSEHSLHDGEMQTANVQSTLLEEPLTLQSQSGEGDVGTSGPAYTPAPYTGEVSGTWRAMAGTNAVVSSAQRAGRASDGRGSPGNRDRIRRIASSSPSRDYARLRQKALRGNIVL